MEDTGCLWSEISPQVRVTSARKGAIFPILLTFPSEASLWKFLLITNHMHIGHSWQKIFMHSYDLIKAMLNIRET